VSDRAAGVAPGHGLSGTADAGAFLARLTRFDPAAVVRLRSNPESGRTELWARLPWTVLVSRSVAGAGPGDATVSAADLLGELGGGGTRLPARRDADWRWPLPGPPGRVVETLAGADLRRISTAAAGALRVAATEGVAGRAVGQRALRDALLDHVAVVVTGLPDGAAEEARVEVSQRLVQAVVRMGFLGTGAPAEADHVQVRLAGRWTGLVAPYGSAWLPRGSQLSLKPRQAHPFD
jgi:hypothetical protein